MTTHELKPWATMVETLLKRKPSWSGIVVAADRWAAVVEEAREVSADYIDRGKAMPTWKARAARTVLGLAEDATSRELLVTVASMYLLRESRPARFRSDRAFSFQVTRRCRNMTTVSRGSWFDEASGQVRHCYATPPENEVLALGGWLNEAFGTLALALARAVMAEQKKAGELGERTHHAVMELNG
ncbi:MULTISPECIES: hypothetical protein [unclassified Ensifer]|uniref:hypothetical protein n=1 Tax=unclassified Ensifer TaxID=2633371 RepID=UPI001146A1F4|nr:MULTISPECIES: hypothetical protein [unclassified Ensifer]